MLLNVDVVLAFPRTWGFTWCVLHSGYNYLIVNVANWWWKLWSSPFCLKLKSFFKKLWFLTFCIYIRYNSLFCSWFLLSKGVKERPLKLFGWSLYVFFSISFHQLWGNFHFLTLLFFKILSVCVFFSISFIARPSHEATRVNNLIMIFVKLHSAFRLHFMFFVISHKLFLVFSPFHLNYEALAWSYENQAKTKGYKSQTSFSIVEHLAFVFFPFFSLFTSH